MMKNASVSVVSRRRFLRATAIVGVGVPFLGTTWTYGAGPNSKLHHACIGVGGEGWPDLQNFLSHPRAQIVALCDVDKTHLAKAAKAVPGARTYTDWRELLEKEGDRIDSVNVTVPDHMHFAIASSAVQRGKHLYCQKPMCHDIMEVRALTQAALAKGVVTQLGTQTASGAGDRTNVRLIQEGAVGKIKHAYLCSNRPHAVQDYRLKGPRPAHGEPPPPYLNWEHWIGTAPMRPFVPHIYHPTLWRAWQDFGTGWSGDIGCHIFSSVWKGLGLKPPRDVVAEVQASWKASPARRHDNWPQADHITWTFPGNELTAEKELTLEWFDGSYYPPQEVRAMFNVDTYPTESSMLVGTEGALLLPIGDMPYMLPLEKYRHFPRPKVVNGNHYHLFVDACLGGAKTESRFDITGPMTEAVLLGTVAIRVPDTKLTWDSQPMRITNHPDADQLLRRHYRAGWHYGPF